jgi:hypothetical protein
MARGNKDAAKELEAPAELTAEFCRGTKHRIVFRPENVGEAALIARQMRDLGFRFYNHDHASNLHGAVSGCMYLDNDKTLMVTNGRGVDGIVCGLGHFGRIFEREGAAAGALLTAEDVATRALVFYPRGFAEAFRAVSVLAKLGAAPGADDASLANLTLHGVNHGLVVRGGRLSAGPVAEDLAVARICAMGDFGMPSRPDTAEPDNNALLALFNDMSARMKKIETQLEGVSGRMDGIEARLDNVSGRMETLEREIMPRTIEKSKPGLDHG